MPIDRYRDDQSKELADYSFSQNENHSAITDFASGAWSSLKYSAVQSPLTGASQLIDYAAGTKLEEHTKFFDRPEAAQFGSAAWAGQTVGGTIGGALPFVLMARVAGPGAASKMETSSTYGILTGQSLNPVLKSVAAGAAFNAVFTPVEHGEGFVDARLRNAAVGGITWGALTSTSIGLKGLGMHSFNAQAIAEANGVAAAARYTEGLLANSTLRTVLKNDAFIGAAGGVVGGVTNAQLQSVLAGRGLASLSETVQSASTFALGGALMGGANSAWEKVRPTSGIRGARTLEDITKMADATVSVNAPPRYFYDKLAEHLAPQTGRRAWLNNDNQTMNNMLTQSHLSAAEKASVVRASQDLVKGLEALHDVGPIATIYGSARMKSDTFAYQRGRLTGALLSKEGYAVMTGGGPGLMEAGNRGAYQAGGKSIGVNLELPKEQGTNGYQTINLQHKDFGTRNDILRSHEVGVVEKGGLGSVYELAEELTHLQTKMKGPTPVYIVSEAPYKHFDRMVKEMEQQGLVSKGDSKLYKLVRSPFEIVKDLVSRNTPQTPPAPAKPAGSSSSSSWFNFGTPAHI